MQRSNLQLIATIMGVILSVAPVADATNMAKSRSEEYRRLKRDVMLQFKTERPTPLAPWYPGIKRRISSENKIIALTFDACGGKYAGKLDTELIKYLTENNIPATLFVSGAWIDRNPKGFMRLSRNPLFEIENHGLRHRPCCISACSKYNIRGTGSIGELVDEVELNARKIEELTGRRPIFFRAGTAWYDAASVRIIQRLNHIPVNFSCVGGDASKTSTTQSIVTNVLGSAKNGAICLLHMNHPERHTASAMKKVIPLLKKQGFVFVRLEDYKDRLE